MLEIDSVQFQRQLSILPVIRWTNEDSFSHRKANAACVVTRNVAFSGQAGETRPANMAVLYYMKIQ